VGSMGGLIALKNGAAMVAGSHLFDPATRDYNFPFLAKYLARPRRAGRQPSNPPPGTHCGAGQPQGHHRRGRPGPARRALPETASAGPAPASCSTTIWP
jgi:hypothetical protein